NIIRNLCVNILYSMKDSEEEIIANILAFEKILDINLDVMTSSYIEEEIRNYSSMYRIKNALIDFSEKFLQSANLLLILALIGLTLGAIGLFITDVQKLFTGDLENGIITSLGSMLIIWVMIELMNTEISHLKGGKFRISVFISVALVTVIRETMIATLKHEQSAMMVYLIAAILVIGFVYWLVIKGEEQQR
ncbi:MAG: phosphate-starvation-inducible PsiE family protein, partial [Thermodesulfovibrionales bacterium]|nr:phosphate-starvation-inducible PsiE family protein [Thermodesulfovibrionales bacterium]